MVVVSALARVTDALLRSTWHQSGVARRRAATRRPWLGAAAATRAGCPRARGLRRSDVGCHRDRCAAELRRSCAGSARCQPRSSTPWPDGVSSGARAWWRQRWRAPALDADWVDIRPIMVTDGRFGRATPYVQVSEQTGPRVAEAVGGGRTHSGDAGLHRSHRHRSADHARPRRLRLHRGAARCGARRGAGRDLDRRGRTDDGRSPDRSLRPHPARPRATRRRPSWPPSAPGFCTRPPPCRWFGPASPS